jgi:hypothetical protein
VDGDLQLDAVCYSGFLVTAEKVLSGATVSVVPLNDNNSKAMERRGGRVAICLNSTAMSPSDFGGSI